MGIALHFHSALEKKGLHFVAHRWNLPVQTSEDTLKATRPTVNYFYLTIKLGCQVAIIVTINYICHCFVTKLNVIKQDYSLCQGFTIVFAWEWKLLPYCLFVYASILSDEGEIGKKILLILKLMCEFLSHLVISRKKNKKKKNYFCSRFSKISFTRAATELWVLGIPPGSLGLRDYAIPGRYKSNQETCPGPHCLCPCLRPWLFSRLVEHCYCNGLGQYGWVKIKKKG